MSVQQSTKVLDLLQFYARVRRPASLAEVSHALGWPRSSTFSLLQALAGRGFLYEPVPREGYFPSPRWLALSQRISDAEPLPEILHALLDELCETTRETVAIGGPAGTNAMFLAVRESPAPIRYFADVGLLLPIHATSVGRALLEQYSRAERVKLYRSVTFQQYGPATPISIEAVEAEIKRGAARGWHGNQGECTPDLVGVSIPLPIGRRRLALVVAGPSFRMAKIMASTAATMQAAVRHHAVRLAALDHADAGSDASLSKAEG